MTKTIKTVLAIIGAVATLCTILLILKKKFGCCKKCGKKECECDIAEMADQVGHDERVRLVGAKNIKFTNPIIPSEATELRFNLGGEGSERTVEILSGETLCAKMSLSVA